MSGSETSLASTSWSLVLVGIVGLLVVGIAVALIAKAAYAHRDNSARRPNLLRAGLVLTCGVGAAFAIGLAIGKGARTNALQAQDSSVARFVVLHRIPSLNQALANLTRIGAQWPWYGAVLIVSAAFAIGRRSAVPLVIGVVAVVGAWGLQKILGKLVGGPNPPHVLAIGTPSGYPSGGTIRVLAFVGFAAWIVSRSRPRWAPALWATAAVATFAEAFTRLYLNRHWFWDIIGGLAIGALWLAMLVALAASLLGERETPPQADTGEVASGTT